MKNVLMPENISEKQINDLLNANEFKEYVADIGCVECGGPQARGNEDCASCNGHGIVKIYADITPETVAAIYQKAVEMFQHSESKIITFPS